MNNEAIKHVTRKIIKVFLGFLVVISLFMGSVYLFSYMLGPPDVNNHQTTIYYSNDGEALGEEEGLETRYEVSLQDISPDLIDATLLTEDRRFYDHKGLDYKRILGAAVKDIKNRSLKEGASTLTQQYARNLYLTQEKTWTRKLKEAFYAIRLEMFYSKEDILEGYLNTIYYGHGAYGIQAASRLYFNKDAADLTLAESAMLAGIPKGPTYYSPLNDVERATKRQKQILKTMRKEHVITASEYEKATQVNLHYSEGDETKAKNTASYFQDSVLQEAARVLDLDMEAIRASGFQIHTTLDKTKQAELEKQIKEKLGHTTDVEVGALAMNPNDGAIEALVGGKDYEKSSYNRATQAKRLPGSTFKPFLYYAALESGFTPSTMLKSKPTTFTLKNGETYQPRNFNGYYANDTISLAEAIALSDNIYAVKTHLYLGTDTLPTVASKFGFKEDFPSVPSLALGTAAVSLQDMVRGYGMIANNGKEIKPFSITRITKSNGKEVYARKESKPVQQLNPQSAYILTQLLTGMFDEQLNGYASVTGASIADIVTKNYAGKSGTTDTDSWMIGYTPSLVTGVWVGYDDNRSMGKTVDTKASKEIWAAFMENASKEEIEKFPLPSGVVGVPIDPSTGKRATPYCPTSRMMYYKKGNEPREYCQDHLHKKPSPPAKNKEGIFERWFKLFLNR